MDTEKDGALRDVFLWKVLEQFEGLSRRIGEPFRAKAEQGDNGETILSVWQEGEDEAVLRVTASFDDSDAARRGWDQKLSLVVVWKGEATEMLVLGWSGGTPDIERGLDSLADRAEGEYPMGKVVQALRADVDASLKLLAAPASRSVALRSGFGTAPVVYASLKPVEPARACRMLDVESVPVTEKGVEVSRPADARLKGRIPSLDELKERLIAETFEAMQHELLRKEAGLAGAGILPAAKANFIEAVEWAMLGVAYAVDAVTSRTAIGSFIPGEASWLYGLVGPVLIGGLASLAKSKTDKAAAFGLMASWALAVGLVTASDKNYLDGAQAWFPKGEAVLAHQEALSIARLDKAAAEKEVARLESKPGISTTAVVAEARKRWQAKELKEEAKAEKTEAAAALTSAKAVLKRESGRVVHEESELNKPLLADQSRSEAWRALFAILTIINFAGPYAISRVVEKWRHDHATAKSDAEDSHYAREGAKVLRGSRPAQKARAMQLFGGAVDKLAKEGMPGELLNELNGADVAAAAAERLDRSVNAQKFRPKLRLWGADRS